MKVDLFVFDDIFSKGKFNLKEAPFKEYIIKNEEGLYIFDEEAIRKREDYEEVISIIDGWLYELSNEKSVYNYSTFIPDFGEAQTIKDYIPEKRFPTLSYTLNAINRDVEVESTEAKKLLMEIEALHKTPISLVKVLEKHSADTIAIAVTSTDSISIINSTTDYTSYLDTDGFNVLGVGAFEIIQKIKLGITEKHFLKNHPKIFNANQFTIEKTGELTKYTNIRSGQSVGLPLNLYRHTYEKIEKGSFQVEYESNHVFSAYHLEILELIKQACLKVIEVDGRLEFCIRN